MAAKAAIHDNWNNPHVDGCFVGQTIGGNDLCPASLFAKKKRGGREGHRVSI
jgi:hypothetical protein